MKYRIMLVDDEIAIRNLLKLSIDWASFDMEIAGEAANGIEAINIIDEIRPHILIVDVRMPFMDGIEFSKIAIQRYENTKIIILSAYDDFEYARACIGIGIIDYLLKPVVRKEINTLMEKLRIQLDSEVFSEEEEPEIGDVQPVIDRIREYIHKNYLLKDLSLMKVSKEFGFNASYLSRRFKAETGKSFVDCLTECRMEHAILLAKKGIPMYIAAREVGIPDPNYFGKCFKKYTGINYSAYSG
ncbi:MAG: response regulator [Flexilinea sp.]